MQFLVVFLLLSGFIPLFAQISPGELTKSHSFLEGMSNCTKCHEIGKQVSSSKCLKCHNEINNLLKSSLGYHSDKEVKGKNCWTCHSEHNGRNFKIIKFDEKNFNHSRTGFTLTGAHSNIQCKDCHQSKYISDKKLSGKKQTYLGLTKQCNNCHLDYHLGTLSALCTDCHTTEAFKPAAKFNHSTANFKLTGKHTSVECIKCHPKNRVDGKTTQKFTQIKFDKCFYCHSDIHNGKFSNDCQQCHTTASFRLTNKTAFDHDKTNYPLRGKHISVACKSCHKNSVTEKLKYQNCTDCHNDYHLGDFSSTAGLKDCSFCHNENGFTPSLFSISQHQLAGFKLSGAHLAIQCSGCHYKNDRWKFKNIGSRCIDCHKNIHNNEIIENYLPEQNCTNCHNENKWKFVKFDHSLTGFSLEGKHKDAECSACHLRDKKDLVFASLKSDCINCHEDVHNGQFNSIRDHTCQYCHSYTNWKPEKFDHDKTLFPLTGAHAKVSCSECHKKINKTFTLYKIENFKCASCHS